MSRKVEQTDGPRLRAHENWHLWEWTAHPTDPDAVMVFTESEHWYTVREDGCSCPARLRCAHEIGLEFAGGVEVVLRCLSKGVHPRDRCLICSGSGKVPSILFDWRACTSCKGTGKSRFPFIERVYVPLQNAERAA